MAYFLAPVFMMLVHFGAIFNIYSAICLSLSSPRWENAGMGGNSGRFLPGAIAQVTIPLGFPA